MTFELFIQVAAVVLGSNWLGQILLEVYKTRSKRKTPAEIILKYLARNHLLQSAERYKEQGYINADEYDEIHEAFTAYEKLGGNGRAAREYGKDGELQGLPVK